MKKTISPNLSEQKEALTVGLIGSGRFGEATAALLAQNENIKEIVLHTKNQEDADFANETQTFINFPDSLSEKIRYSNNPKDVINETTDAVFSVLGAQDTPMVLEKEFEDPETYESIRFQDLLLEHQDNLQGFFSGTKGIIEETRETISQYLRRTLGDDFVDEKYGYYYGPMFADQVLRNDPTIMGLSSFNNDILNFGSQILRTNTSTVHDSNKSVEGAEVIEAFKNVAAIASGMALGLYGENTSYSIQQLVIKELKYLCKKLGLKKLNKIFRVGSPSMSDLSMTCNSPKSRNFKTGFNATAPESQHYEMDGLAEGVETVKAIYEIALEQEIDIARKMPVCHAVYRVLHEGRKPELIVPILLKRIDQNSKNNK